MAACCSALRVGARLAFSTFLGVASVSVLVIKPLSIKGDIALRQLLETLLNAASVNALLANACNIFCCTNCFLGMVAKSSDCPLSLKPYTNVLRETAGLVWRKRSGKLDTNACPKGAW